MNQAAAWLADQIRETPPELVELMLAAIRTSDGRAIPEALAAGAMTMYETAIAGSGGREDALALLSADALFTHAFQAQADIDPDGLAEFVRRWSDGARLRNLLRQ